MKRVPGGRLWVSLVMGALLLGLVIGRTEGVNAQGKPTIAILPFLVERGEDPQREAV